VKKVEEEDDGEERKQEEEGKREDGRLFRKLGSRDSHSPGRASSRIRARCRLSALLSRKVRVSVSTRRVLSTHG